jgi:transposase InsO family protein
VHELAGRGVVAVPSRSGVYRALVRNGLIQPGVRRRRRADYRRWERGQPMQLWQMDVMGELRLAGGREAKLVTGLDDHSRFCVAAGVVERATAQAVCRVFTQALARYGVPEELLTETARCSPAGSTAHPARCCSSGSAASMASPSG